MNRRQLTLALPTLALAATPWALRAGPSSDALLAAVNGPRRTAQRSRDGARHPAQTLAFWGLAPGMTVVEIEPSGGYWTEILAPYLKATGGRYIAALGDGPKSREAFKARFADETVWGKITLTSFSETSGPLAPAGSVDLVITARNLHDWMWTPGFLTKALGDFHAALKSDGLLGVEEHRADPRPMVPQARDGYVETAFVIDQAKAAGFRLEAASEVNANPKDTKDYPFGVWTLPPTLRKPKAGDPAPPSYDPKKYPAIGESDRMTLRFRRV